MKKILLLLLFTVASYGQAVFDEGIQITGNSNSATATKVNVQEANGKVNTQTINTGFNKNFGLNSGDVVGATTLLNQYSTTPVDWTATAFNSGQVVFYAGKQWIAKIATVAGDVPAVSSKWEEITFEALSNKTTTVDQTIIDGSTNAVSGNAVFDALATKAPISSVHNPVTLGTANGLSLSTQQLSLGLASSGVSGALSGTDWNYFKDKQDALGFTPENVANKATDFTTVNNTLYPSVQAIKNQLDLIDLQKSYLKGNQITTTALGAATVQEGTGNDANNVFVGKNNAGTTTSSVSGAGTSKARFFELEENAISSDVYRIYQPMALTDYWAIYGSYSTSDKGDMVFEVGDNGTPFSGKGQRFRFSYDASSTGTAKNPLIIDYNDIIADANLTATSFIKSGGLASQALLANGAVLTNPISGTGTTNKIPKFTGTSTLADGVLTDMSTYVAINQGSGYGLNVGGDITGAFYDNVSSGGHTFYSNNGVNRLVDFLGSGVVKVTGLAGSGDRVLSANSTGELIISTAPTAPTAPAGTNTTQVATTAFVQAAAAGISGSYTPTASVITGATGVIVGSHTYTKIGNIVTVYGESKPSSVVAAVGVVYEISLPIARANTVTKAIGFGGINVPGASINQHVRLESSSTTTARIDFNVNAAGTPTLSYSFQYDITQ